MRGEAPGSDAGRTERQVVAFDGLIDLVVAVLAAATLAYHAALVTGAGRGITLAIAVALSVAICAVALRPRHADGSLGNGEPAEARHLVVAALAAGGVVAGVTARLGASVLFWLFALLTVGAGLVVAYRSSRQRDVRRAAHRRVGAVDVVIVAIAAVAFVAAVVFVRSPNADDTYYLNRALYIATHDGPFPSEDTIYGDQSYPSVAPPNALASFEALAGMVAWATSTDVRTVYYLVFPALFAAIGVLMFWRLARHARARSPSFATVVAVAYLMLDTAERGWGAFALRRLYQGKAVLLLLLVPWLWTRTNAYLRSPSFRSLVWVAVGAIASVGVSSTGALIAPIVIGATGIAALLVASSERRRAVVKHVALLGIALIYPIVIALISSSGGADGVPEDGESFAREITSALDAWTLTLGDGLQLVVVTAVVLMGWALVRAGDLRLGWGVALLAVVIMYSPPGLSVLTDLGLSRVSWRFLWVLPVPIVVGLMVDALGRDGPAGRIARAGAAVVVVAALAMSGRPLVADRNAEIAAPSWDVDPQIVSSAERLVGLAPDRGLVAAPAAVSRVVPMVSTRVFVASARESYTSYLGRAVGRSFRADDRRALTAALTGRQVSETDVADALDELPVDAICDGGSDAGRLEATFRDAGFERVTADQRCTYWQR